MSGNNLQVKNETHIPSQDNLPNEQNKPQYPADVEAEIHQRVNEELPRERGMANKSSHYTHFSREEAEYEGSEAHSAQNNPHERCPTVHAVPIVVPATQSDDAMQKLQNELEDMKEMIKALMPITASKRECKTKMPFTERLDVVPLPKGFVLPQFTQFGGTGDPIKHLQGFLAKMIITSNNPDIYAKAFSNSLSESLGLAHQVERALMDIEQGPTESLKSYQKRYNDILLNIPEVNNKVAYMAFYRGLRYGKLKKTLVLEMPLSKDQLTARVKQYVELEELKTKEAKAGRTPKPQSIQRDNRPRIQNEPPETPLLTGRIDTIAGGRVGGGDSRNSRKTYARKEVYSIAEATTRKEENISFNDKDLVGIELQHDDPVVIALVIANFTIERMLVDTGSLVDVLYLSTFYKLQLPRSLIKPMQTPINRIYCSYDPSSRRGNIRHRRGNIRHSR
ncbi:hypothetical protein LIER_10836 [Lithospermum erythrorhizon]|uniref:Retrotransposon gag domain-containing protein n=1 Tax=Lithospermum erythrorhizon TaxID=34254 RepID=A0AAV3PM29_LITER